MSSLDDVALDSSLSRLSLVTSSSSMAKPLLPARWYFNVTGWKPTRCEWEKAIRCVQQEEKARIERFVFKEDVKSSLIGRLLLRKLCSECLSIPYNNVQLGRNSKDRPYLINNSKSSSSEEEDSNIPSESREMNQGPTSISNNSSLYDFNISHHGSYCVLAAENNSSVGIDVMRMVYTGTQTIPEMFELMKRKFTRSEWDFIAGPSCTEREQTRRFYRTWSLKESFVKAEGSGLGFSLQRLSFQCNTPMLTMHSITTDTKLLIDGTPAVDWHFEECLLDQEHCVVVALLKPKMASYYPVEFKQLNFDQVLENSTELLETDGETWTKFDQKPFKAVIV